jgi:thiol-disulfide isomerase/thioredoxin
MKSEIKTLLLGTALLALIGGCGGGGSDDNGTSGKGTDDKGQTDTSTSKTTTYYTRACVMDFTATWCPYCPQLMRGLEGAAKDYPDRFVILMIHDSTSELYCGDSNLNRLASVQGVQYYPTGLCNFRTELQDRASSAIVSQLTSENKNHKSTIGIGVTTKVNDKNDIDVSVKLKSGQTASYKIAMYVVEDSIVHRQNDGGVYNNNFVHYNIPLIVYPSPDGSDLGTLNYDAEKTVTYTFTAQTLKSIHSNTLGIAASLDYSKCRVVVYVLKKTGSSYYIDNSVSCPAKNGTVDYKTD